MKINSINPALAAAAAAALVWTVRSLLVWLIPVPMMNTTGHMMHTDMNRVGWMLSPIGFFWGLIAWSLFAGIFAWLVATIYNLLTKKE